MDALLARTVKVAALLLAATLLTGTRRSAHAQRSLPDNLVPEAYAPLRRLGDLQLRTWSIHGVSPLVVLFTEAPAGAPAAERRYRHRLTAWLIDLVEREGMSWFSLRPVGDSSTAMPETYAASAEAAMEVLRRPLPGGPPQVVVGFGEGAALASRLLSRDSSFSSLLALAPSLKVPGAARDSLWDRLLHQPMPAPGMLVVESGCGAALPTLSETRTTDRRLFLIVPQYNEWLEAGSRVSCGSEPGGGLPMTLDMWWLIGGWIRHHVVFPE